MSWGQPESLPEKLMASALLPASAAYGIGSYLRLRAYGTGYAKRYRPPVRTISIGNITCGGTGKTPVTIDLARRLTDKGARVGILSRGYKRKSSEEFVVASDGKGYLAQATECGDEPYIIARSVPTAVVLVGARRTVTAQMAVNVYGCDILILDDGFQHLALNRNDDLVLLDYSDDPRMDALLPAGRLREPLGALARATHVVLTRAPQNPDEERVEYFRSLMDKYSPHAEFAMCSQVPARITPISFNESSLPVDSLKGLKVVAFCGLAKPEGFYQSLLAAGAEVLGKLSFPDHHWYTDRDLKRIKSEFSRRKAKLIVTTQKDAARLSPGSVNGLAVSVLEIETKWHSRVPILDSENLPVFTNQVR